MMYDSREEAIFGGLGLSFGAGIAFFFLPSPALGIPIFGVAGAVFGMSLVALAGLRLGGSKSSQDERLIPYASLHRL